MKTYFTGQRNVQIVITLMKQNGIKRVVTSPGMTDVAINISLQHDPYFELYSCVDERSAYLYGMRYGGRNRRACSIDLYRRNCLTQLHARHD